MSVNIYTFDIKKYKSKFKYLNDYFELSRSIKSLRNSINEINKKTKYEVTCSICLEILKDNKLIDSYKCKHLFHAECLHNWMKSKKDKGEDPVCPNCRCEKNRGILFFPDMYNYRQWRKQYSGTFESVTRPKSDFSDIEIIENLRYKRYILETRLKNIVETVEQL